MTTPPDPPARFLVELVALPDPLAKTHTGFARTPEYRLRLLLKGALRSFGLKCVSARQCPPPPGTGQSDG